MSAQASQDPAAPASPAAPAAEGQAAQTQTQEGDGGIVFDPAVVQDDGDSTFDSESLQESTSSVTSSIFEYRTLHGRKYQSSKTTEYWAPNDDKHIEAFDVAHHWLTMMIGDNLFKAPIGDNPGRVLDVGTGTGIWAIDMADTFPEAEVIGTDISPIQPQWVPPNCRFEIDDAQQEWTFPENSFDFIHLRYMHAAIGDWNKLYRQMYKALKPGGWFQQIEPNIELRVTNPSVTFNDEHVYKKWAKLFYDAGDKIGSSFRFSDKEMVPWAEQAGFTNITHERFVLPHGRWPKDKRMKEMGQAVQMYMNLSLDGFAIFPIGQILGWTLEEVQVLVAQMRAAINDPKNCTVSDMHIVYGQKPMDAGSEAPAS